MTEREQFWVDYYRERFRAGEPWLDYSNACVQMQTFASALDAAGPVEGRRCLDVGCGRGQFARALHGLNASAVTGVDIVPEVTGQAAAAPAIEWLCGSLQDAHVTARLGEYELVFLLEVLQYVPLLATLEAAWRHVAPGGRVVIVVPNGECPIAGRTRARFGARYDAPTGAQLIEVAGKLSDVERWALRGMFFRADQTLAPYALSAWGSSRWPAPPNRLQCVVLKRGDAPSTRRAAREVADP
jgi:2-polyprenyl-3-methyl-5-hydroxy-6-metoxy-1,4-benzoquinol methylase